LYKFLTGTSAAWSEGRDDERSATLELIFQIPYSIVRNGQLKESMMAAATLTSKGQITIPASVRAALGLDTGSRVEFVDTGKGQFAIVPVTSPVLALKGVLNKPSKPVSIEDMNEVIATQGAGKR